MKLSVKKTLGITAFSAMLMATTSGWSMDDDLPTPLPLSRMASAYYVEPLPNDNNQASSALVAVSEAVDENGSDSTGSAAAAATPAAVQEEAVSDNDSDGAGSAAGRETLEEDEGDVVSNDNNDSTASPVVTEETKTNNDVAPEESEEDVVGNDNNGSAGSPEETTTVAASNDAPVAAAEAKTAEADQDQSN